MSSAIRQVESFLRRGFGILSRFSASRAEHRSKRADNILMILAAVVFLVGFVFAYASFPNDDFETSWGLLLLVAVVGVPLTVATNTAEYLVSVKLLGYRVPLGAALRVSVVASAANFLPLPGSVLVRTRAIRGLGANTGSALGVSTLVGVAWVATGMTLTGGLLLAYGRMAVGALTFFAGAVLLGATLYSSTRLGPRTSWATTGWLVLVEVASVLVKGVRLYVIFHALQFQVDIDQAMALAMAAVLSVASGFLPGGLGLTEVLSAAVSPVVDVPAAAGLLAAAIDRLIGLGVLGLITVALIFWKPAGDEEATETISESLPSKS